VVAVPRLTPEQAEEIALRHYGVNGSAGRLAAEHDDTFRLTTRAGHARLLKITVAGTAPGPVSLQTAILLHLAAAAPRLPVQRVTAALNGAPEVRIPGGEGPAANRRYLLRRTPQAIEHLTALRLLTPDEIARTLRAACGTSRGM
jgi:Ser/Thr protein kinase RdoA (MazF antagonist)